MAVALAAEHQAAATLGEHISERVTRRFAVEFEHEELRSRAKIAKIDLINASRGLKRVSHPEAQVSRNRYLRALRCSLSSLSTFEHSDRPERPRYALAANVDHASIAPR